MWIRKKEIERLSEFVKGFPSGEEADIRDNKEGAFSVLKNDINSLVTTKNEQLKATEAELVEAVKPSVNTLLDINNQTIELANDCVINCDKRWTVEALTNIIKNAIEHSPNDSRIAIDSGENPLYYWISVTDSGAGMNRSSYSALFKRFEYSTNENGFGIGMPLFTLQSYYQNTVPLHLVP